MSRGLGATQRSILAALQEKGNATVSELCGVIQRSENQVRTAIHSLEQRGLIVTTKGYVGWTEGKPTPNYGMVVWTPENHAEALEFASRPVGTYNGYKRREPTQTEITFRMHHYR
jgi:DeoR/GlpR family transcriptional regulator of sugar metabolism